MPEPFPSFGSAVSDDGVHYTVWAPEKALLIARIWSATEEREIQLTQDADGFHRGIDPEGRAGDRYQFLVDDQLRPDPASRSQADSVHGPSVVVDPRAFRWTDEAWTRPPFRDLVIYELHVGTFTTAGKFRGVIEKLPYLRELGVTAIELMPIGDFPGTRNWGYDGVLIYAPARAYGSPDDLRALVDAAHASGIAVILDVVYNHFGPDGNYLGCYSRHYASAHHHTPWGTGFNLDGPRCGPVRDFFVQNVVYWMEDFHVDGFRLDATHEIADHSPAHLLAEIATAIHARGGYAIAEDSRNEAQLITPRTQGGMGFDAVWADDFHHVARVGQTGEQEGYFRQYRGTLAELVDTLQHGWVYRGQASPVTLKPRGTDAGALPPSRFLFCISNHDQAGNRAFGERLSTAISPEAYRALSALLCLSPFTPMLFMGQEWAASTPFLYFTDHHAELGKLVTEGRRREFEAFEAFRDPAVRETIPDPQAASTFEASKLKWNEATGPMLLLYRECLRLRREFAAFRPEGRDSWSAFQLSDTVGGIKLRDTQTEFLVLFCLSAKGAANLPAEYNGWRLVLASDETRFGGSGCGVFNGAHCDFQCPQTIVLQNTRPNVACAK